jgi:hypothetical protein
MGKVARSKKPATKNSKGTHQGILKKENGLKASGE